MPYRAGQESEGEHRVVVTGAGLITSMGCGWRENADGFRAGRLAFREISLFDVSRQRVQTAGEVVFPKKLPESKLTPRQTARLDRASRLLIHAGAEALAHSGWDSAALAGENIPLCLGTSAGSMGMGEAYYLEKVATPGRRRGLAQKVTLYQPHTQAQHLLDAMGLTGPITIIANACASGANAIGHAFRLVKTGRARRAVAGGYDALAHMVFAGFDSLQALSTTLPRPFDAHRDGLALGEGAGIVTLERLDDAVARGAEILAEVGGYGASTDLHHLTQPNPQGDAALLTMTRACEEAKVNAGDVQYINSHGTGTPLNDVAEGNAIRRWAGPDVAKIMVSSTKSAIGHLLGGAGAVEAVLCLLAMKEGFVPANCSVETLDPVCTFDLVLEPREAALDCTLTNSFGFGGANATLIFQEGSMKSAIHLTGWGAVSVAGWGVAPLYDAVLAGEPLPFTINRRAEDSPESRVRKVPALSPAPDWMKHNRMRRTTAAARHAVGAAMQALGPERLAKAQGGQWRVGIIFCTMNGCVQFSRRFFAEALQDPKLASPILFPETVHNAPASHIASLLGSPEMNNTLVGDSSQFLRGLEMGAMWLDDGQVDAALVVAAEELDWVTDEALLLFHREGIVAEGAAAVLMESSAGIESGPGTEAQGRRAVALGAVTEARTYGNGVTMAEAARRMRAEMMEAMSVTSGASAGAAWKTLLFDGSGAGPNVDPAERAAWARWDGSRVSVRPVLGEGYGVTGGWQTVLACESVARGNCEMAAISAVGLGKQAVGAVLAVGREV